MQPKLCKLRGMLSETRKLSVNRMHPKKYSDSLLRRQEPKVRL